MDNQLFNQFRSFIYKACGISISEGKQYLIKSRIEKRLRALNLKDEKTYYNYLTSDKSGDELISFINVISTNTTNFFREVEHFDILTKIVKNWLSQGKKDFRIWCAASSTGEEPYTIGMKMAQLVPNASSHVKILATDISTDAIATGVKAVYEENLVGDVPETYLKRYFDAFEEDGKKVYQVKDEIKQMVNFRRTDLSKLNIQAKDQLDIVFCRNVMIYFDHIVRQGMIDSFYQLLKSGGYLFISLTESLNNLKTSFVHKGPSVFIKP